jgi:hypothetical protein
MATFRQNDKVRLRSHPEIQGEVCHASSTIVKVRWDEGKGPRAGRSMLEFSTYYLANAGETLEVFEAE